MKTRHGVLVIATLLAGCGGGGSDDTAVSANPPAPVAAVETPVAPPVKKPPPTETPESPQPVETPPIAQPPAEVPAAPPAEEPPPIAEPVPVAPSPEPAPGTVPPPVAEIRTISGWQLANTFLSSINTVRPAVSLGTPQIGIGQYQLSDIPAGILQIGNSIASINNSSHPFPSMAIGMPFQLFGEGISMGVRIDPVLYAQTMPEGAPYTFPVNPFPETWYQNINLAASPKLTSPSGFLVINPDAKLSTDTLLKTWTSDDNRWFVEYRLRSETPDTFKTCWEVLLPTVARRSCYAWNMQSELIGTYVMDNSDNTGAIAYRWDRPLEPLATKAIDPFAAGNLVSH